MGWCECPWCMGCYLAERGVRLHDVRPSCGGLLSWLGMSLGYSSRNSLSCLASTAYRPGKLRLERPDTEAAPTGWPLISSQCNASWGPEQSYCSSIFWRFSINLTWLPSYDLWSVHCFCCSLPFYDIYVFLQHLDLLPYHSCTNVIIRGTQLVFCLLWSSFLGRATTHNSTGLQLSQHLRDQNACWKHKKARKIS